MTLTGRPGLFALLILLAGCATAPPDGYVRLICFEGYGDGKIVAGVGSGGVNGRLRLRSVQVMGEVPDEAVVKTSEAECPEGLNE